MNKLDHPHSNERPERQYTPRKKREEHQNILDRVPLVLTREEDEMIYGEHPPHLRWRSWPMFYRDEVNMIRADKRNIGDIAFAWGVAKDTIMRIKRRGRFANVPYVPRDEVDRSAPRGNVYRDLPKNKGHVGRGFNSGRAPLTELELHAMVTDPRTVKEVAYDYKVSDTYVYKAKKEYRQR